MSLSEGGEGSYEAGVVVVVVVCPVSLCDFSLDLEKNSSWLILEPTQCTLNGSMYLVMMVLGACGVNARFPPPQLLKWIF